MSTGRPNFAALQEHEPSQPPKSLGERLLNAIPIVMTVLATLLAGLASSEMTQAQYHRSLAAQNQSKAGNQWNFFQAKRQRSAIVAGQVDALRSELAAAEPDNLGRVDLLAESLRRTSQRVEQLLTGPGAATGTDRPGSLRSAVEALRREAVVQAETIRDTLREPLSRLNLREVRDELRSDRFSDPRPTLRDSLETLDTNLAAALVAIDGRQPDAEIALTLANVTAEHLLRGVALVEARATALDGITADLVKRLDQANDLLGQHVERFRNFQVAVRAVERTLDEVAGDEKDAADVRRQVAAVLRAAREAASTLTEILRGVQLARNQYNERRYECEARYNQVIGGLFEAQVRKSGLTADRHRQRSYLFFYCMLVAQGGVTLATFALAMRHMSLLWGLATCAGLAALAGGVYVYRFI